MIGLLTSFGVSLAAGKALDLYNDYKSEFDQEFKNAFEKALNKWSPKNTGIINQKRGYLRRKLKEILSSPIMIEKIKDEDKELYNFYQIFEKILTKYKTAHNYLTEIKNLEHYNNIIGYLSIIKDGVERIESSLDPTQYPLISPLYIERDEEKVLKKILLSNNVLLLTGISFCGKSQTANRIASNFVLQGYRYVNKNNVSEAERLLRGTKEKIVFILEDPFGHDIESENRNNWRFINELVKNLNPNCKLIITSRIEILKSINNIIDINDCTIDGNKWIDLTLSDINFLRKVWKTQCKSKKVDERIFSVIDDYLKNNNEVDCVQIGQLNHLSNFPENEIKNKDLDQLLHLAKADSKDISLDIKNRGKKYVKLFSVLGLSATTNISIHINDISYILSNSSEIEPGFNELEKGIDRYIVNSKSDTQPFPEYPELKSNSVNFLEELDFFEIRGFINNTEGDIKFTHPTYLAAAKYLLLPTASNQIVELGHLIKKIISSLKPEVVINCSNQFDFISKNTKRKELEETIKSIAIEASKRSLFPAVRDKNFSFLLNNFDKLDESTQDDLTYKLNHFYIQSNISWHNDIPYITEGYMDLFFGLQTDIDKNQIDGLIEKLNSDKKISLKDTWAVILSHQQKRKGLLLDKIGVLNVLKADEVFIRGRMALLILKHLLCVDKDVLRIIFSDSHPAVILEAVKGAFYGYPKLLHKKKKEIKEYIVNSFSNWQVAIRANNLISTFGIDYGSESIKWNDILEVEKKEMWQLWSNVFPVFFNKLDYKIRLNDSGRFTATLQGSEKYLSDEDGLKVADSIYKFIDIKIRNGVVLDSHELGVVPYLLNVVNDNKKIRFNLFKKIFSHKDTGFIIYSLSWSLIYWDRLTSSEKDWIIELLDEQRSDKEWIKSAAITVNTVPIEIQLALFKKEDFLENEGIKKIIDLIGDNILFNCLRIYFGNPSQFGWLGLSHSHNKTWIKIQNWILEKEYSVGFDLCLEDFIFYRINDFIDNWEKDSKNVWEKLCFASNNKKRLAEKLILATSESSFNVDSTKIIWQSLIKGYETGNINELANMVIKNLDYLQVSNYNYIHQILPIDFLFSQIIPKLKLDNLVFDFVKRIKGGLIATKDIDSEVNKLIETSKNSNLYLKFTEYILNQFIDNYSSEYTKVRSLEQIRYNRRNDKKINKRDLKNDRLEKWNSIYI